jgi:hypothetical protein
VTGPGGTLCRVCDEPLPAGCPTQTRYCSPCRAAIIRGRVRRPHYQRIPPRMRECPYCGKTFQAVTPGPARSFCYSDECWRAYRAGRPSVVARRTNPTAKKCPCCQTIFATTKPFKVFCKGECRERFHSLAGRLATLTNPRVCDYCQRDFFGRLRADHCSPVCAKRDNEHKRRRAKRNRARLILDRDDAERWRLLVEANGEQRAPLGIGRDRLYQERADAARWRLFVEENERESHGNTIGQTLYGCVEHVARRILVPVCAGESDAD